MYIILGGTGHVGSSVAATLLEEGKKVTVISHDRNKVDKWEQRGAKTAVVDVSDSDKLREVFKTGTRLFLLNPPAKPSTDTVAEEQKTLSSILKALENSGIEKVVAESTLDPMLMPSLRAVQLIIHLPGSDLYRHADEPEPAPAGRLRFESASGPRRYPAKQW